MSRKPTDSSPTYVASPPQRKTLRQKMLRRKTLRVDRSQPFDPIQTRDGLVIRPVYTRKDLKFVRHLDSLPGEQPYLRGPYATMYRQRPWTIRQYAGMATASDTNAFYRRLLATGAQGISVAFDLPTQRGYDSDHPMVAADVGKAGVAIDCADDMVELFDGIPLDQTSVSMTINGGVLPILASLMIAAEKQGVAPEKISGTVQNDILKEFLIRNTYIYPPSPSLRIVRDVIGYCNQHLPLVNSISVSGYHMHEAGAGPALELAYALSNGREYLRSAVAAGLDVDDVAPRMSFFFAIGMDFYTEIAKLRAARVMWSEIMDEFRPQNPKSRVLRMHCQTSGWSLTQQDPMNNIVRTTVEAMAGVFGGTQSMHTNSFDEAINLPSENAARIARNTQVILQEETGITRVADPWGGSYMMENLTDQLMRRAGELINEVESFGGMAKAIELGLPKLRIEESAAAQQADIDNGSRTIVGVNKYVASQVDAPERFAVDGESVAAAQRNRLDQLRRDRNQTEVAQAIKRLTEAARAEDQNLVVPTINAMRLGATVGEVSAALESVWGRHQDESILVAGVYDSHRRDDAEWQSVADRVTAFTFHRGRPPRILISKLGQDGHDRGQRVVACSLADIGFEVVLAPLFVMPAGVAEMANEHRVDMIGISTMAAAHAVLVPELMTRLSALNVQAPVVVGGVIPVADRDALIRIGVSQVFEPGTPIHEVAQRLMTVLEQIHCDESK